MGTMNCELSSSPALLLLLLLGFLPWSGEKHVDRLLILLVSWPLLSRVVLRWLSPSVVDQALVHLEPDNGAVTEIIIHALISLTHHVWHHKKAQSHARLDEQALLLSSQQLK